MLTRSLAFLGTAAETLRVTSELQKLLPILLPLLDPPLAKGTAVSAAHLIVATSHEPQRKGVHLHDCPVLSRAMPLTVMADHAAFLKRPCQTCLKRRVHFLASEHFCRSLAEQCAQGGDAGPAEWEKIAARHFGSLVRLGEELVTYATSRREPGWTWLVYDNERGEDSRLVAMNLPANRTPLVLGLWPLAVIDMTEAALLAAIKARSAASAATLPTPPWSHAARSSLTAVDAVCTEGSNASNWDLSVIRGQIAREAVLRMNWSFVLRQWQQAVEYYTSADRDEKIRSHFSKLERAETLAAVSKLRDSGATVLESESVEIATNAEGGKSSSSSSNSRSIAVSRGKLQERAHAPQEAVKSSGGSSSESISSSDNDPQCSQLTDGTWQYVYRNGDVTLLRPDGTRIFKKSDLTTTAYANGGTLYEYPNNTSIFDRADGVRLTTFADGTTKEERWK